MRPMPYDSISRFFNRIRLFSCQYFAIIKGKKEAKRVRNLPQIEARFDTAPIGTSAPTAVLLCGLATVRELNRSIGYVQYASEREAVWDRAGHDPALRREV